MRAVITGGAGFLGSHLIDYLRQQKHEIVCLDRPGCNTAYLDKIGVPVIPCDVLQPGAVAAHIKAGDFVFHLAAFLGKAKVSKAEYRALNIDSAAMVCQQALEKKAAKIIFPSSMAAMGPIGSPEKPMDETNSCAPATLYGETKLAAEQQIKTIAEGKMDCIIFRPPPFFGPRMNPITSSFILFDKMRSKTIALVGDTENYFPLCYVKNLAKAMVELSAHSPAGIHTYLVSDGPPVRFSQILMALRKEFGINEKIIHIPYGFAYSVAAFLGFLGKTFHFTPLLTTDIVDGMARSVYFYDMSKAFQAGFKPDYSLDEGVRETVNWLKST